MPLTMINNIQIYYELHGAADKPVVLFLHGLGSSMRDWEPQQAYFMKDYRVLLVDIRGHGRSEKPRGPYTVSLFSRDVIGLLDYLKIDKVHVVGLSMGGMIAFQMAVDFPQRFLSMTIVNSGPALVPRTLKDRFGIWLRFFIVRVMGIRRLGETLAPRLFPDQEALRQMFISRWSENEPRAYMASLRAIVGWTVEDRIHSIAIPTLIIASDQDYTPLSAKESYIRKMSGTTLKIIENAHHAVTMERPDVFNGVLAAFLQLQ